MYSFASFNVMPVRDYSAVPFSATVVSKRDPREFLRGSARPQRSANTRHVRTSDRQHFRRAHVSASEYLHKTAKREETASANTTLDVLSSVWSIYTLCFSKVVSRMSRINVAALRDNLASCETCSCNALEYQTCGISSRLH